jgi:hypothetical protein
MDDPTELEGKMAFDRAFASLAAQRTDLQQLQGRAKDLIGFLTLAASFLGAFGKATVEGIFGELDSQPKCLLYVFLALPAITLLTCLFVMVPRSFWVFDLNAESVADAMKSRQPGEGFATTTRMYLWYVYELAPFAEANTRPLKLRKWAIWCATSSLAASVAIVGYLAVGNI